MSLVFLGAQGAEKQAARRRFVFPHDHAADKRHAAPGELSLIAFDLVQRDPLAVPLFL